MNIAVIRQTERKEGALSGAYYVLTRPDGSTIGANIKKDLMDYARQNGWETQYVPLRAERKGVVHGFTKGSVK